MESFQISDEVKRVRPTYKKLTDVAELGIKDYATRESLSKEFLLTKLRITHILSEAEVWPIGSVKPASNKGRPTLAFNTEAARVAVRKSVQ